MDPEFWLVDFKDGFNIVHRNWLSQSDQGVCHRKWPDMKNDSDHYKEVRRARNPAESWEDKVILEIIGKFRTFDEARLKFKRAEEETDINSDAGTRRKRRPNPKYLESDSEDHLVKKKVSLSAADFKLLEKLPVPPLSGRNTLHHYFQPKESGQSSSKSRKHGSKTTHSSINKHNRRERSNAEQVKHGKNRSVKDSKKTFPKKDEGKERSSSKKQAGKERFSIENQEKEENSSSKNWEVKQSPSSSKQEVNKSSYLHTEGKESLSSSKRNEGKEQSFSGVPKGKLAQGLEDIVKEVPITESMGFFKEDNNVNVTSASLNSGFESVKYVEDFILFPASNDADKLNVDETSPSETPTTLNFTVRNFEAPASFQISQDESNNDLSLSVDPAIFTNEIEFRKFVARELLKLRLAVRRPRELNTTLVHQGSDCIPDEIEEMKSSVADLIQWNSKLLKDNVYYVKNVKEMARIGGHTVDKVVKNILTQYIHCSVGCLFSWEGAKKKMKFKELKGVIRALEASVRSIKVRNTFPYVDASNADIQKSTCDWLRQQITKSKRVMESEEQSDGDHSSGDNDYANSGNDEGSGESDVSLSEEDYN